MSRSQRSTPNLTVSALQLQFEFTYCNEMMHKAWSGIGEVPYCCFSRPSVKFKSHTAKNILSQIGYFLTVTPVWIQWWLQNDAQSLKCHRRYALLFWGPSVKFQAHTGHKINDFDPNCAFPLCSSSLIFIDGYGMMHRAWSSIEEVHCCLTRSSVIF